jgi:hypothetical protein
MLGGSDNAQHSVELAEMVFLHAAMTCSAAPSSQQPMQIVCKQNDVKF